MIVCITDEIAKELGYHYHCGGESICHDVRTMKIYRNEGGDYLWEGENITVEPPKILEDELFEI